MCNRVVEVAIGRLGFQIVAQAQAEDDDGPIEILESDVARLHVPAVAVSGDGFCVARLERVVLEREPKSSFSRTACQRCSRSAAARACEIT